MNRRKACRVKASQADHTGSIPVARSIQLHNGFLIGGRFFSQRTPGSQPDTVRLESAQLLLPPSFTEVNPRSTVDELLEAKTATRDDGPREKATALMELTLKAVALAMGVGVVTISLMDKGEPRTLLCLLGIGLACLALVQIAHADDERP